MRVSDKALQAMEEAPSAAASLLKLLALGVWLVLAHR